MKLITVNIEGAKHLDKIFQFIKRERPDVVCVQEIFERDVLLFEEKLGCTSAYFPMTLHVDKSIGDHKYLVWGIAIFSRHGLSDVKKDYYFKSSDTLQEFDTKDIETKRRTVNHGVVSAKVRVGDESYSVATTHFTWTPKGVFDTYQKQDVEKLLELLGGIPEIILCGDFNAPRGHNKTYNILTERYKDNIPAEITSTLDADLHRAKNDPLERERISQFAVDYIFSTPAYRVTDVRKECGLSDHCAIIGEVSSV